jgi:predicted HicB family RNase H-like nuclease
MKAETFTFRIKPETRAALEQIAASKEWSAGHLVNSILTEYVASISKPVKAKRVKPVEPVPF